MEDDRAPNGSDAFQEPRWFGLNPDTRDLAFIIFALLLVVSVFTPLPSWAAPLLSFVPCIGWDLYTKDKIPGYFDYMASLAFPLSKKGIGHGFRKGMAEKWRRHGLPPAPAHQDVIEP